jgi:hypothetical protein
VKTTVSNNSSENPTSVTIIMLGYRERCSAPRCYNRGRLIFRYADPGGRPICSLEFCYAHARVKIAGERAAGLKVYDDRDSSP